MTIKDLGFTESLASYRVENNLESFEVGRVISEHKERYDIKTPETEYDAELIGNLRFTAVDRYDFPAVGDWVAFSEYDEGKALIHAVYPRSSIIERQAVAKTGQVQIIATNIDYGMIVQAVDRDFNLNRLERYLTICHSSKVKPIIVLSKIDLIESTELAHILDQIKQRIDDYALFTVTNQNEDGYQVLSGSLEKRKTYCLLGSSGVGKSTLLNNLAGKAMMETGEISTSVNKGRHVTSHRELIVLDNGSILIDNPGMREVGIADSGEGLETTFASIIDYANACRYADCTHVHEKGCAVLAAVESGDIDEEAYVNFRKMEKEKAHFESDAQDRKRKDKELGRMIKEVKTGKYNHKYK